MMGAGIPLSRLWRLPPGDDGLGCGAALAGRLLAWAMPVLPAVMVYSTVNNKEVVRDEDH
jgi:hypothetical protein